MKYLHINIFLTNFALQECSLMKIQNTLQMFCIMFLIVKVHTNSEKIEHLLL